MGNNFPKISIVIAFYNEALYLDRCLQSVVSQTYKNIELILINDGSTDNSLNIVQKYIDSFIEVKLITIENSGPGNARNIGIENTTGKYLSFLDADDEIEYNCIEKMYNSIIESNSDLIMCLNTMLDSNFNIIKKSNWLFNSNLSAKTVIALLVKEKFIPTVWGKLFKTSIAKKCKFLNTSWKEDDVFVLNYLMKSKKIVILKEYLIKINCRNNSLTRQVISSKMIQDICLSYKHQYEILNTNVYNNNLKYLIENKINTFLNLFLILKIDYNKIENRKEVLNTYFIKLNEIKRNKLNINIKKKIVLLYLIHCKKIGLLNSFLLIQILKYKTYYALKKIKY